MRQIRQPKECSLSRLAAVFLPMFCCGAIYLEAQQTLPDAPQPAIELASVSFEAGQTFPPAAPELPKITLPTQPVFSATVATCEELQSKTVPSPRMSCGPMYDPFQRFLNSSAPYALTAKQKAILAWKGVSDPFNLLTIGGISAISIASDSHSAYGPGVEGWAKLSGVSLTQDMTHEFLSTFLISSLAHQDPHYHRMPNASYKRRIAHCIYQVVWTQGDNGRGMFNYANVMGGAIEEGISDAYVPYRDTGWGAAASRYGFGLATDPIGNFITEFVPDVSRHVNIHIVFVQRLINQVARQEGGGPQ
jgi:hypothetical protein